MKNKLKIVVGFLLLISFFACQEKDLKLFDGGNEIFFEKFYIDERPPGTVEADSTVASFFFYPDGTQKIKAPLVLCLSGRLLEKDASFKIKVVEDLTTANPDEYTISENYVFRAKEIPEDATCVTDTINIDINLSNRLSGLENGVVLVVELIPNEQIGVGQIERRRAKIILTTQAAKPDWWDNEVTNNLLGEFSNKKYKLFLNNVDVNAELNKDLIVNQPNKAIELAIKFRDWLNSQNPKVIDEDGSEMTVAI